MFNLCVTQQLIHLLWRKVDDNVCYEPEAFQDDKAHDFSSLLVEISLHLLCDVREEVFNARNEVWNLL